MHEKTQQRWDLETYQEWMDLVKGGEGGKAGLSVSLNVYLMFLSQKREKWNPPVLNPPKHFMDSQLISHIPRSSP